jgi:DNA-binding MarR family transcriptional regulator
MQQLQKTTISRPSPDECARELLAAIPAVMRFIRNQMRRHRQSELTVPQFRTLVFLSHHPETTLSALAEYLGLSRPAASRMVDLLVKRGLMNRQIPPADRRQVALSLTRRGKEAFLAAHGATRVAMAGNLEKLSAPDLNRVREAMQILNRAFTPINPPLETVT